MFASVTLLRPWLVAFTILALSRPQAAISQNSLESTMVYHKANPKNGKLRLYWKDESGKHYESLGNLKQGLKGNGKTLRFAMNAGIYMEDLRPLGLFIEAGVERKRINKVQEAYGNFYLQPNGVFYVTNTGEAAICRSDEYKASDQVEYATQSGPMLLINGAYHPKLNKESKNKLVRNGVGILASGEVLFAMSKSPISFYDFATFFKEQGCENALYLDGVVSRCYLPEKGWEQLDGRFGVIIGELE